MYNPINGIVKIFNNVVMIKGGLPLHHGFILTDYPETKIYTIPRFTQTGLVAHGFTTRLGGRGKAPYDTLNLAFHVGDAPDTVIANRQVVCRTLGAHMENLVSAQQVHGTNIRIVSADDAGKGAFTYNTAIPDTDGLITNLPELLLATFYADCVPIFILDPVHKVIGSVHAGWKGTVGRIGALAIDKMRAAFGSNPRDCLVGIGPSIGPRCYEVDDPVIARFQDEFGQHDQILESSSNGRAKLNLWQANRQIMAEAGILPQNIELANICTCCNPDTLFSYRGEKGTTGRMGAFIIFKP
jgi:YfiH family protein